MRNIVFGIATLLIMFSTSEAYGGEVAVIVNQSNAVTDISFRDLVKIFKQEKQHWNGKRIYLLMRETGAAEKEVILEKIYKMDELALKKFWLGKLYRGDIPAFPKTLGSNEAVSRFVSKVPNAIGFIDADAVDDRIQVLRINGKLPGERGYALTGSFAKQVSRNEHSIIANSSRAF